MNIDEFSGQITVWRSQLSGLLERTNESAPSRELLKEALGELHIFLEELMVAEEELHQQNQILASAQILVEAERHRYQELFEFAPDGYLLTNEDGVIQEANRAATTLLNVSQKWLIGKLLTSFIPLTERQSFRFYLHQLHKQDQLQEWFVSLKPRNREPIDVAITMASVRDHGSKLIGLRWQMRDITERRQIEKERAQLLNQEQEARKEAEAAQARITNILESITDAFFTLNTQWHYTYVNSQAEQLLGKTALQLIGSNIWEVFPDTVNSQSYTLFHQAVVQRLCVTYEEFFPMFDKWFAVRLYPSPDGLSVYFLDITERKRTEEALQESEARFRRLVESNIIGSIVMDFKGNITEANDAFLLMVGYTKEDVDAGKLRWLDMTPRGYLGLDKQAISQVKKSGTCTPYEKEFICHDSSRVTILIGMALLEGSVDSCICFVLDLTQTKLFEKILRQQAAELTQANRIKDEFLAIVSHELRSPLSVILGWVQTLRNGSIDAATTARAIEIIERSTRLQIQLIEDILDISKIITGKLQMNLVSISLAPIIEAAIDTVRPVAKAKQIQLQSKFDARVGKVLGDPKRLQQVMWNLLSNAVKFTPQGGKVEVRLSLSSLESLEEEPSADGRTVASLRLNGSYLQDSSVGILPALNSELNSPAAQLIGRHSAQIEVSDTGIGINLEFLPFVFERFRQADSTITRSYGGMGLGLALVRHLVEMHGGTVHVTSPGKGLGTTFTVKLPINGNP